MNNQTLNFAAVCHTPDTIYAYPVCEDTLCLRLKTAKNDCVGVSVRFKNIYDHTGSHSRKEMMWISADQYSDYYETTVTVIGKRFKYFFEISDCSGNIWDYSYNGFAPHSESFNDYFFYPYLFPEDVPFSPVWAAEGLIYQIFIDRFYNGDKANDPADCQEWGSLPEHGSFYGGDFKGISDKMNYIASLGATMIYVNPIFLSDTNHKYDTIDYYRIDPAYGTMEEAQDLVKKAHSLGIRVILDAVFNHCSDKNALFLDAMEKGSSSKYYDWFCIEGSKVTTNPPNYDSFAGLVPEMPRLNSSNPLVADYCINAAVYWTKVLDIDGWRLDVADEVSHNLWKRFRSSLRMVKPDVLILGEVWNRATPWLMGDEFDSFTNYKFRNALLSFAGNPSRSQSDFWEEVSHNEMNYRSTTLPFMVNLVSSHDAKRVRTALQGNHSLSRLSIGVILTYPGIPLIYYGDEVGIEGGEDPDNRRTMKWEEDEQDKELLSFVRSLGNLRQSDPALSKGGIGIIRDLPSRVLGFKRMMKDGSLSSGQIKNESRQLLILANFNPWEIQVEVGLQTDTNQESFMLSSCMDNRFFPVGKNGLYQIRLDGYDFLVLKPANIL